MTGTRVLVVDDEPTVREVVVGYLRRDGHEVAEAADGTRRSNCSKPIRPTSSCST